jgi:hypothetical protein
MHLFKAKFAVGDVVEPISGVPRSRQGERCRVIAILSVEPPCCFFPHLTMYEVKFNDGAIGCCISRELRKVTSP